MPNESTRICSTRSALSDMVTTASRHLNNALLRLAQVTDGNRAGDVQREKADVVERTRQHEAIRARFDTHCRDHGCGS
jgi:hypothetical protein